MTLYNEASLLVVLSVFANADSLLCSSTRKDCKMALLQMSCVEEAAEALIVRHPYCIF